uniref:Signal recognition particle 19 kDa protein n=1 Tax=Pavo cristatus TaxID=9049 RepID=A0A8C9FJN0_PAVCR
MFSSLCFLSLKKDVSRQFFHLPFFLILVSLSSVHSSSLRSCKWGFCQAVRQFICIYPAYLNNKKTIAEGRRIPIDKVSLWNLNKNKMYPREWNRDVQYRGRVRIQLKQDDGNPCLPQFPTRE